MSSSSAPLRPAVSASAAGADNLTGTIDTVQHSISIRGARVNNLKNVSIDIPRDRLTVITGPSGSGKSSLAFDTLVAEGQRQYIESLSIFSRQFFHQMERPDVDSIVGLQPTIAIDQRAGSQNPRSTVATVTEIYDYLRLLMARLGEATCPECGTLIQPQQPEEILEDLLRMPVGSKLMLLSPMVRGRRGQHQEVFADIRKAGFLRARVDGEIIDIDPPPDLSSRKNHTIEAVIDRIIIREGIADRLAESIRLALQHGEGTMIAMSQAGGAGDWADDLYSTLNCCPNCKTSFEELEPRSFSFNSPHGACPACQGLGTRLEFDEDLVLPDAMLSLVTDAVAPWTGPGGVKPSVEQESAIDEFLARNTLRRNSPLELWKPAQRLQLWRGGGQFIGLELLLQQQLATATEPAQREKLESFRGDVICAECGGSRLRREARNVRFEGRAIHEICGLPVSHALKFFRPIEVHSDALPVYQPLAREILGRLTFLEQLGLGYLALSRPADTLSGGELQRVRLATGIGSGLLGICYVLDEPSIGLHPRDNQNLIDAIRELQRQGNTVLVVEHDEATMRAADYLIDVGPGAGEHGGTIVAEGTPDEVSADPTSITGQYLSGALRIEVPQERRKTAKSRAITLEGATANNLKNVEVRFPLSALVCVTGVSGSGKSTLLNGTFARAITRRLTGSGPKPGPFTSLRGVSQIDKLIHVDQSPIGRTPRSNPATYTGLFDEIRKVFAGTREAKQRGYRAGRFSFNAKGGRCEECQGQGVRRIEMNFLPDLYVPCEACGGSRFNPQTLEVRYKERSIADVLAMSVDDAVEYFENFSHISRQLASLQQVGLGYLSLGQSSTTLSGGEAQRIKLATELARSDTGQTLYLLDEPTTGLHFDDIRKLLVVLNRLVDLGNTVIVIEHNLDVIKCADWIIDMGPEGGDAGGQIIATGTPEEIAAVPGSLTGKFLQPVLQMP
ncbi:MAG: excinuclease ABC subunit UvrA [Planctomycetota bacterium]|nr:excinuclease ABC subunit UvrA [Planctomycetota bacterium]